MAATGQSRRFRDVHVRSAYPPDNDRITDIAAGRFVRTAETLSSFSHFALMPYSNWVNPESPAGKLRADGKKVLTLNSSIRYCALRPAPQLQYTGKLWLVRELPKNRRRTEVPVSFSGSAGAVGRHDNNSK